MSRTITSYSRINLVSFSGRDPIGQHQESLGFRLKLTLPIWGGIVSTVLAISFPEPALPLSDRWSRGTWTLGTRLLYQQS